jgi:hypothetical protein
MHSKISHIVDGLKNNEEKACGILLKEIEIIIYLGCFTFFHLFIFFLFKHARQSSLDKVAWTRGSAEESAGLMSSLLLSFSTAGLVICFKCRMQNKLLYN